MDIQNMTYTDKWNLHSVDIIENMQQRFQQHEWWLVNASYFGDNRHAFLFFFPLLTGLYNVVGVKTLWAAIIVEWTNLLLKWTIKGDRPYWWTNITPFYDDQSRPKLQQFFNTCETGPGTPSGHVMMNVAIIYIVVKGIRKSLAKSNLYRIITKPLSVLITATCLMWLVIVFMSRLYIQAHFLHQCIFGVIIGYIIGKIVWSSNWLLKSSFHNLIIFALILIGSSFWTYSILIQNGLDPFWSIPLAKKHCANMAFVNIDTQPYFLMVRFTASAVGLGVALSSFYGKSFINNKRNGFMKIISHTIINVAVGRGIILLQGMLAVDELLVYLVGSFMLYFLLPIFTVAVIPYQLSNIFKLKRNI